jgi:hypothetical protein
VATGCYRSGFLDARWTKARTRMKWETIAAATSQRSPEASEPVARPESTRMPATKAIATQIT